MKIFFRILGIAEDPDRIWDTWGFFNSNLAILAGAFPFFFTATSLFMDFDALNILLNYIFQDAAERSREMVLSLLALRSVSLFLTGVEFSRSGCFFALFVLNTADQYTKLIGTIIHLKPSSFISTYKSFSMLCTAIEWEITKAIHFFAFCSFWSTVGSAFILIHCWGKVEAAIYGTAALVFILLLAELTLLLPPAIEMAVHATEVVLIMRKRMRLIFNSRKTKRNRHVLQCVEALMPVSFWYAGLKRIDWDYFKDYFMELSERTFEISQMTGI